MSAFFFRERLYPERHDWQNLSGISGEAAAVLQFSESPKKSSGAITRVLSLPWRGKLQFRESRRLDLVFFLLFYPPEEMSAELKKWKPKEL